MIELKVFQKINFSLKNWHKLVHIYFILAGICMKLLFVHLDNSGYMLVNCQNSYFSGKSSQICANSAILSLLKGGISLLLRSIIQHKGLANFA